VPFFKTVNKIKYINLLKNFFVEVLTFQFHFPMREFFQCILKSLVFSILMRSSCSLWRILGIAFIMSNTLRMFSVVKGDANSELLIGDGL